MRTKTLLLTAALGLLGGACSFAQVYSVNAVGYVNQTWTVPGYLIVENPLNNGDNKIGTVIPTAPEGSTVATWNSTTQDFNDTVQALGGSWFHSDFSPADDVVLAPGTGAFFYSTEPTTITFVGDVPQGDSLTVVLNPGYNLVGSIVPQSASFGVLGLDAVAGEGDTVQFWNGSAVQDFYPTLQRLGTDWYTPDFTAVVPTPAVGEAFFYYKANPGSANWTRSFHVNP